MSDLTGHLWTIVLARDRKADGLFVYAVSSTGVFCRPSCPSRRPARERVEFFPSAEMAGAHGYRACRRCRPEETAEISGGIDCVRRACQAIATAPERPWTAAGLSKVAGASVSQVQRAFRRALGMPPRDYLAACRRRSFLARLRTSPRVTAAVYDAGYGSSRSVYEVGQRAGMTPATYAKGGRGAVIDWITTSSPIGVILVAATSRGVCFVEVGPSVEAVRAGLEAEFPAASISSRPSRRLRPYAAAARAVASAHLVSPALPADILGTAFQWKVWRALQAIPMGTTVTYTQLAKKIGAPSSVRAVARACATNPIALFIPCHRVVGADGSLRGYRWGLAVKRKLIEAERGGS